MEFLLILAALTGVGILIGVSNSRTLPRQNTYASRRLLDAADVTRLVFDKACHGPVVRPHPTMPGYNLEAYICGKRAAIRVARARKNGESYKVGQLLGHIQRGGEWHPHNLTDPATKLYVADLCRKAFL